jgi:hypothetical protein
LPPIALDPNLSEAADEKGKNKIAKTKRPIKINRCFLVRKTQIK